MCEEGEPVSNAMVVVVRCFTFGPATLERLERCLFPACLPQVTVGTGIEYSGMAMFNSLEHRA